jgi:2-hydroxychromene-2-carboxylate isomerase
MTGEPVRFYFDYVSPFAYVASRRIQAVATQLGRAVEPIAVLFAGLLNHFGHVGPAEIEPKRRWAFKQALRRAQKAGLPLEPPPQHPFNPLLPLRVTHAAAPDQRWPIIDALFRAAWQTGAGVETAQQVRAALAGLELDVDALVSAAESPPVKAQLKTATEQAVAVGVFGVPTFVVDGELYWGDDNLDDLLAEQQGGGPIWDSRVERWLDISASAKRAAAPRR